MKATAEKPTIKAIIGLGNPGAKYSLNRHNIGFQIIDSFAEQFSAAWKTAEDMDLAEIRVSMSGEQTSDLFLQGRTVYLVKPQTFMNSSGKVIPFLQKRGILAQEILVIHDELEKDFGKLAIRLGGSSRGHNGLRSIINILGTNFWRLCFGIGRPENKDDVPNYVLTDFTQKEQGDLDNLLQEAVSAIKRLFE